MRRLRFRILIAVLQAAATFVAVAEPARAGWAPTHKVEFVIPFGPGGGADILARTLIRAIEDEKLVPVPIVPVNRGGGGTAVGVSYVKASYDGDPNVLVLINPQTQLTPMQVAGAAGWRDLTPLTNIMVDDYTFITKDGAAYADAAGFIEAARGKPPGTLTVGSAGTADDLAIALLERAGGVKLNIIRYNSGAEALTAVLGGHIDAAAGNPLEFLPYIQGGMVRPLGIMRETRLAALQQVPTLKEQGLDVAPFQMWRGIALPANVQPTAVAYWQGVFKQAVQSPIVATFMDKNLGTLRPIEGAEYTAFLEAQEATYRALLPSPGTN